MFDVEGFTKAIGAIKLKLLIKSALTEYEKDGLELQDGEEFATIFNDGVLILGLENGTLKANVFAGKPCKIDFSLEQ